jgi:hypothetical protein
VSVIGESTSPSLQHAMPRTCTSVVFPTLTWQTWPRWGVGRFVGHDESMVPMDESSATKIEAEYMAAWDDGQWRRRVTLPNEDVVELRSPQLHCVYEKSANGTRKPPLNAHLLLSLSVTIHSECHPGATLTCCSFCHPERRRFRKAKNPSAGLQPTR